jgi:predicted Zn-dependent peptidase
MVSGMVDSAAAVAAIERALGQARPDPFCVTAARIAVPRPGETLAERIERPLAQAALGYVVPAPPPATREGIAWRILLYILTHDYGGRLGDEAISDRGLVYHIDSAYRTVADLFRTGPAYGGITLSMGVDPTKVDAMEAALRSELARLVSDPPTSAEVSAAKRHLLGRDLSAAQSNEEIASRLARQWIETSGLGSHEALGAMLEEISAADVAAMAADFARGTILRVDVGR